MNSVELLELNPLGGYTKIKNHLRVAHKIPPKDQAKIIALVQAISKKRLYDQLCDEMR